MIRGVNVLLLNPPLFIIIVVGDVFVYKDRARGSWGSFLDEKGLYVEISDLVVPS